MNQSTLFSFDDSTIWDPKVKLRLSISEDQLNILNTLQEWNKAQDNNTIRIEKDSLIENSQPQNSVSQNDKIRKQNIELFYKNQEHRRCILKTCNTYIKKFTKSISLLDINKADRCASNSETLLKRTSSLSSIYHLLIFSHIECTKEPSNNSCSPKKHSSLHNSQKLSNFPVTYHKNKISVLELKESKDSFCNREITSEDMEVVSQLPVNISTRIGKAVGNDTDIKAIEEKLPQHCDESPCNDQSVSFPEGLVKHDTSSLSEVKTSADSHISISCEKNGFNSSNVKETVLVSIHENTESNQLHQDKKKYEDNKDVENFSKEIICVNLNTQKSSESFVSTSCEGKDLPTAKEKMAIDVSSISVKNFNSGIQNLNEIANECVKPIEVTTEERSYKGSSESNSKNVPENCNKINDEKMDVSENDQKILNDADNSGKLGMPIAGKRKLDSKPRRSKKLKSEERQERMKVRSIKKVGEISYCAEDVKDMLDIIKLFL